MFMFILSLFKKQLWAFFVGFHQHQHCKTDWESSLAHQERIKKKQVVGRI